MRYIWIVFGVLLVAMLALLPRLRHPSASPRPESLPVQQVAYAPAARAGLANADSVVAFALAQRGTPYVWAGTSPLTGFDCSGFILYTFARFGVPVPHSTALLIDVGRPVARADAQPGDIVVFTGTDPASATPGHAGIVITRRGELPLRFVHASSSRREPFVRVSQVEGSDYERRFMQVRRVLGSGTGVEAMARAKVPVAAPVATPARPAPTVAALPLRRVAVAEKAVPIAPLPAQLPKLLPQQPMSRRVVARKPIRIRKAVVTHKASTKATAARKRVAVRKATAKPAFKSPIKPAVKARATSSKSTATKKKRRATR